MENYIAQKMGFEPMTRATHIKDWGKPLEEVILERIPGIDAKVFMRELEYVLPEFIEKGEVDVITDINLETLDQIRKNGTKTAILTSRTLLEAKHLLDENHPLSSRIDAFYHKDNTEYLKPDPKVFDKVLKYFKVKPHEAVYIGDSVGDAISAKGAGLHFIALLESELKTKEDFQSIPVDYFASKFRDIIAYIESH
jgi:phosphoglycolate phosphatase-like HAD superfamily hydrolase